ncbi:MAG: hypothetical protein NTY08_00950 [Proteobacteria bacterium]|nr:hypothetical protein [Pseudomonadota bacterium]
MVATDSSGEKALGADPKVSPQPHIDSVSRQSSERVSMGTFVDKIHEFC